MGNTHSSENFIPKNAQMISHTASISESRIIKSHASQRLISRYSFPLLIIAVKHPALEVGGKGMIVFATDQEAITQVEETIVRCSDAAWEIPY